MIAVAGDEYYLVNTGDTVQCGITSMSLRELGAFDSDVAQTFVQCGDLTQPLLRPGLGQPVAGVGFDEVQALGLLGVQSQERAAK